MYYIIFNPTAGAGRSAKVLSLVEQRFQALKKPYRMDQTEYPGHAQKLAKNAVGKGFSGIVSVGGDGTLLEVAESLRDTDEVLGVIPAGTGNDFRYSIGVPKDPVEALDVVFAGHKQQVDIGLINDEKAFLNVTGTGFDVDVLRNTNRVRRFLTGGAAYYLGIVMSIIGYKNATLDITANGKTIRRTVLLTAVANGRRFGGGLQICPQASATDGQFNVVIINQIAKWRILIELPKLQRGELEKIPGLEQFMCSEVTISSTDDRQLDMDGEIYGQTPVTLRVAQKSLNVFCPK